VPPRERGGQPLESLLTDDAAALVTELFDGLHTADDIAGRLPPTPRPMFREGWVDDYLAGDNSWFRGALEENEAVGWAPRAPLRLFYGHADVDVSPDDALLGAEEMRRRGGNVEVVAVGEFDHGSVVYQAVPLVQEWFLAFGVAEPTGCASQRRRAALSHTSWSRPATASSPT
jgi:hypothetical protein